ncbi:MAG: pyruvate kinase [Chitinophagales bacterium]|jgi:pyruvate kinase
MSDRRKVKIVATVGPSSSDKAVLTKLVKAGVNVFRLNFSHGSHEEHKARFNLIREVEAEQNKPLAILMDLQGPKLRLGKILGDKIAIIVGQMIELVIAEQADKPEALLLPHPEIMSVLKVGSHLLVDDGRVKLRVESSDGESAVVKVISGKYLSSRKGINIPDVELPIPALTEKDRADLAFGLQELDPDWIALSFVQRPEDVIELRRLVGDKAAIMAKIEKPSAMNYIDEIIELVDGIMVARGDLGVELPPEKIPRAQKMLIKKCRNAGKPVVVATHMLDSMVDTPVPTRAEASDVATAVYDGTDAVMLSAETAAGHFPVESVEMMCRIAREVEQDPSYKELLAANPPSHKASPADAICAALREVSRVLPPAATVTYTSSGSTSLSAARERPDSPIISLSSSIKVVRRMGIVWGLDNVLVDKYDENTPTNDLIDQAANIAKEHGYAKVGDYVTVTAGLPLGTPGSTNLLRIITVE